MKENSIEDIEELKRLLYTDSLTQYGKRKLINYYEQQEKDYKRILKENEKLREYYEEQNEVNAKSIPVQKVKDKIELLEEKAKYEQNAQVLVQLYKQIKVLKELLEREEIYEK